MHFLVTGHTGFKGSWLVLLLKQLGHEVSGIALAPEENSLFREAEVSELLRNDLRIDVRNQEELSRAVVSIGADYAIHLAAQSMVRDSYRKPLLTFETNVNGTLNFLIATDKCDSIRSRLVVTTDKVYKNRNLNIPYVEEDQLGGSDPYSASKAMADILTQSWILNVHGKPTMIARAGNVIGGGDYSRERLLPGLFDSYAQGRVPVLRFPEAVRPWQHVLDCLDGYLFLIKESHNGHQNRIFNVGPNLEDVNQVKEVADLVALNLQSNLGWHRDKNVEFQEQNWLVLDSSKIQTDLGWKGTLDFKSSVLWACQWQLGKLSGLDARNLCDSQISNYLDLQSKK